MTAVAESGNAKKNIPPVLVLSTGRCGSTMLSDILNTHPRVLSVSETFTTVGQGPFRRRWCSGGHIWRALSRQSKWLHEALQAGYKEVLYPFGSPGVRYTHSDVPALACTTLPHLTDECDALFDELAQVVPAWPRRRPSEHFRALFEWLRRRFRRDVWVERSGASLLLASRLMRDYPDARIVHIYRDGRDTALSMRNHYVFSTLVATTRAVRSAGIDATRSIAESRHWNRVSPWVEWIGGTFLPPKRLPYRKLTLGDYGRFWSAMVERSRWVLADLPPEALLNVKMEDMQAEPEEQIRRLIRFVAPELEDDEWVRAASAIPRPTASRFDDLDSAEQEELVQACRPGLDILGYSL